MPLPRFWYLPRGLKAAVVLTGDDHDYSLRRHRTGSSPLPAPTARPAARWPLWQCVRSTSYLFPGDLVHERPGGGLPGAGLRDRAAPLGLGQPRRAGVGRRQLPQLPEPAEPRPATSPRSSQLFRVDLPERRAPVTQPQPLHHLERLGRACRRPSSGRASASTRTTTTGPARGSRTGPGFFTGSGFPQRFADTDGSLDRRLPGRHAAHRRVRPGHRRRDRGPARQRDRRRRATTASSRPTCTPTTARPAPAPTRSSPPPRRAACPIVSAEQMLTWLDGRDASSFPGCRSAAGS